MILLIVGISIDESEGKFHFLCEQWRLNLIFHLFSYHKYSPIVLSPLGYYYFFF